MEEKEVKIKYKKIKSPFGIDFDKTMEMHDKFIKEFTERTDFVYFQQNKDKFVKLITDLKDENQALKSRWQKLKEWVQKRIKPIDDIVISDDETKYIYMSDIFDEMQELERSRNGTTNNSTSQMVIRL